MKGEKMSKENLLAVFKEALNAPVFKRSELVKFAEDKGYSVSDVNGVCNMLQKVDRGVYSIEKKEAVDLKDVIDLKDVVDLEEKEAAFENVISVSFPEENKDQVSFVPKVSKTFVPWGHFKDLKAIIESGMFFPVFISGLSGNGKTFMVEQACAKTGREYVRIQITPETDEDDLIGGYRLVNGDTVFEKGPVIKAMERGAILTIDEIDRGSNKLMALQGILEGKPFLIKKTGELITPRKGFNIIATANTLGKGDDTGRFIAATIVDDAFLERFTVAMIQPYPSKSVERNIIERHMSLYGVDLSDQNNQSFLRCLVDWSSNIRSTFNNGGIDDFISTRRLCHIIQTYSIFNDKKKAIELCISRFESDVRESFIDLYDKIDSSVDPDNQTEEAGTFKYMKDTTPF